MQLPNISTSQSSQSGSFSVDVLRRILIVLTENGPMRKTNLAGKAGLNYIVCLKYLGFMKMLSWIRSNTDNEIDLVGITELGRQLIPVFTDYLSGKTDSLNKYYATPSGSGIENTISDNPPAKLKKKVEQSFEDPVISSSQAGETAMLNKEPRILLVDDEPDALLTYKSFLSAEGYSVDAFEDPERAFTHFASMRPGYYHLIITDIRMDRMNGLKLYQRIKVLDPSAKIIFVTALDAAEELITILSPQPATILRKPIEQQVFNKCVRSILSLR